MFTSNFTDVGILKLEELEEKFLELDIKATYDRPLVESLLTQLLRGEKIENTVIARGRSPIHGKSGSIQFFINVTGELNYQGAQDTAKVDYKESMEFTYVNQGDVIGQVHPAGQGLAGVDVYGNVLDARDGIPVRLIVETGAHVEGMQIIADTTGIPVYRRKILRINRCVLVQNVGPETGNLNCDGSVYVEGDVQEGYSIQTKEDIFIRGTVHKADIKCGGDLTVINGIQNGDDNLVKVGGFLSSKYLQGGRYEVEKDVDVAQNIMNANLSTLESIKVRGDILGGRIYALKDINASHFGSEMGAKTYIGTHYHFDQERFKRILSSLLQEVNEISDRYISDLRQEMIQEEDKVNLKADIQDLETSFLPQILKVEQLIETFNQIKNLVKHPRINASQGFYNDCVLIIDNKTAFIKEDRLQKCHAQIDPETGLLGVTYG